MTREIVFRFGQCDVFEADGTVSFGRDILVRDGYFADEVSPRADVLDYSSEFAGLNVFAAPVDCQVNGSDAWMFEDVTTEAQLASLDLSLLKKGTVRWCGTFVSTPADRVHEVLSLIENYKCPSGLIGLHFEGPWLNVGYRGAHPSERLRTSSPAHVDAIERAARTTSVVVTLAPEAIADEDLLRIAAIPNVRISVGHSDSDVNAIVRRLGGNVGGLTHVLNCMPGVGARTVGPIGLLVRAQEVWGSVICDGHHVSVDAFRFVKRATRQKMLFLVSDQMPVYAITRGQSAFGSDIALQAGALRRSSGQLTGASSSLLQCLRVAVSSFGLPADEGIRMASQYPTDFLGLSAEFGSMRTGRRADLIVADNQFNLHAVFRDGRRMEC